MSILRSLSLMAALLFLLASPLLAQREDTPISSPDPGYRMLESAKVQGADSANGQVMVVWATTELGPDSSARLALYTQLVRNGQPLGVALRLGKPGSIHSPSFSIGAIGDDFLIFYNDSSAPAGTYSQIFNARTLSLEAPRKINNEFSINIENNRRLPVFGDAGHGWRIIWYTYRPGAGTRTWNYRFDSHGAILDSGQIGSTVAGGVLLNSAVPEMALIGNSQWEKSYIVNRNTGRMTSKGAPGFLEPFHVGTDGSLLVQRDSILFLYTRFGDTVPSVGRILPVGLLNLIPRQGLVWRDTGGRIILYYIVVSSGSEKEQRLPSYSIVRLRMETFASAIRIDTLPGDVIEGPAKFKYRLIAYGRNAGCNNQAAVYAGFSENESSFMHYLHSFLMDSQGAISDTGVLVNMPCVPSALSLGRRENDSLSIVELHLADTITLAVPVARKFPPTRLQPGIVPFPGALVCTWREADTAIHDVQGRWDLQGDTIRDRIVYLPPPRVEFDGGLREPERISQDSNRAFPGNVGLAYNYTTEGIGVMYRSEKDPQRLERVSTSRYAFARPGEAGWKNLDKIVKAGSWIGNPQDVKWTGSIIGCDPDSSTIAVLIRKYEHRQFRSYSLYSYHPAGLSWTLDVLPGVHEKTTIIPMGTRTYIAIDSARSLLVREGKIAGSLSLSQAGRMDAKYHKVYGPRFARTSWDADDTTRFHVEIFDTLGNRLHAAAITMRSKTDDYMLLPFRADSSFVILFGGDRGVRGTVLRKDLTPVVVDTLLSATAGRVSHPAGAFRGDTLFLVWEDYRGNVSRIYGTYHSGSWLPSSVEEEPRISASDDDAAFIYPNPAGDDMTITAYSGNGNGILYDMSDVLGREILRGRIGEGEIGELSTMVDISAVPPGTYIVRVWNNGRARAQVVIKR